MAELHCPVGVCMVFLNFMLYKVFWGLATLEIDL